MHILDSYFGHFVKTVFSMGWLAWQTADSISINEYRYQQEEIACGDQGTSFRLIVVGFTNWLRATETGESGAI